MYVKIGKYPKKNGDRKVVVKFDETDDFYSLDYTLALIILPALKIFRDKYLDKGIWSEFLPEGYYEHKLTKKQVKKIHDTALKKQHEILDKMILAFELMLEEKDFDHEKEIEEGLKLFGKYFRHLWY